MEELLDPHIKQKRELVDALLAKIDAVGPALEAEMNRVNLSVEREAMHEQIVAELQRQRYSANLDKSVKDECKRVKLQWLKDNLRTSLAAALTSAGIGDLPRPEVRCIGDPSIAIPCSPFGAFRSRRSR